MVRASYVEAARMALAEEMERDPDVWAVGEDIGRGGVFGQYAGLAERFGPWRIVDTPISETAIMGAAVGAALVGTRPVIEMRYADFALCAVDELVNQAAKAQYMFGGQGRVPLVVRQPIGIAGNTAAQHSQSLEGWYAHIPGLVVAVPSTPGQNYGLLKSAIRSEDPVVYMEHKGLWGLEGDLSADPVPFGQAETVREGADLTIVTWSAMRHACAAASDVLAGAGIRAGVIDLVTLWPWDRAAVVAAAAQSGALLVVHEAVSVAGFGAEVVASVVEVLGPKAGLRAARLASPRVPVPYSPVLEGALSIDAARVAGAARDLLARPVAA